jgi:hypothetical protein
LGATNFLKVIYMEDRLLILQIAFSMVADSPFYETLILDARIEEVKNVYNKLNLLIGDGKTEFPDFSRPKVQ